MYTYLYTIIYIGAIFICTLVAVIGLLIITEYIYVYIHLYIRTCTNISSYLYIYICVFIKKQLYICVYRCNLHMHSSSSYRITNNYSIYLNILRCTYWRSMYVQHLTGTYSRFDSASLSFIFNYDWCIYVLMPFWLVCMGTYREYILWHPLYYFILIFLKLQRCWMMKTQ
jgi:hypothetical protein